MSVVRAYDWQVTAILSIHLLKDEYWAIQRHDKCAHFQKFPIITRAFPALYTGLQLELLVRASRFNEDATISDGGQRRRNHLWQVSAVAA